MAIDSHSTLTGLEHEYPGSSAERRPTRIPPLADRALGAV
ncbi:hypothetical protein JOE69_001748 [Arthrobacter russicus]|uniref:Uncharacterized protein n=1 Tax=Arthrobacter russicus TaxID=172040 RepID=A0ABU1JAQ9_9MICC|nr:hypothetical protein [Arthrobacter russicus]